MKPREGEHAQNMLKAGMKPREGEHAQVIFFYNPDMKPQEGEHAQDLEKLA